MSEERPAAEEAGWVALGVALPAPGEWVAARPAGHAVVLCNVAGTFHAIEDVCPHLQVALSGGRLEGALLECPLHGGKVDVRSGAAAAPPIRRPARVYALRQGAAGLEIDLAGDDTGESDDDLRKRLR